MKKMMIILLLLPIFKIHSQELKVTYNNRILVDSTSLINASDNLKNKLLMDARGEDYELVISNGISLYGPVALKEDKTVKNSGTKSEIFRNYYETIYTDNNRKIRISSIKYAGETFLINENLEPIEWEIKEETKQIDSYLAKKAEAIVNGSPVVVWFTDEIPINAGPSYYSGLPGLILQAQFGQRLITAKKIEPLNEDILIAVPTEGKKYTREEYENLMNSMMNREEGTTRNGNTTTTITRH